MLFPGRRREKRGKGPCVWFDGDKTVARVADNGKENLGTSPLLTNKIGSVGPLHLALGDERTVSMFGPHQRLVVGPLCTASEWKRPCGTARGPSQGGNAPEAGDIACSAQAILRKQGWGPFSGPGFLRIAIYRGRERPSSHKFDFPEGYVRFSVVQSGKSQGYFYGGDWRAPGGQWGHPILNFDGKASCAIGVLTRQIVPSWLRGKAEGDFCLFIC